MTLDEKPDESIRTTSSKPMPPVLPSTEKESITIPKFDPNTFEATSEPGYVIPTTLTTPDFLKGPRMSATNPSYSDIARAKYIQRKIATYDFKTFSGTYSSDDFKQNAEDWAWAEEVLQNSKDKKITRTVERGLAGVEAHFLNQFNQTYGSDEDADLTIFNVTSSGAFLPKEISNIAAMYPWITRYSKMAITTLASLGYVAMSGYLGGKAKQEYVKKVVEPMLREKLPAEMIPDSDALKSRAFIEGMTYGGFGAMAGILFNDRERWFNMARETLRKTRIGTVSTEDLILSAEKFDSTIYTNDESLGVIKPTITPVPKKQIEGINQNLKQIGVEETVIYAEPAEQPKLLEFEKIEPSDDFNAQVLETTIQTTETLVKRNEQAVNDYLAGLMDLTTTTKSKESTEAEIIEVDNVPLLTFESGNNLLKGEIVQSFEPASSIKPDSVVYASEIEKKRKQHIRNLNKRYLPGIKYSIERKKTDSEFADVSLGLVNSGRSPSEVERLMRRGVKLRIAYIKTKTSKRKWDAFVKKYSVKEEPKNYKFIIERNKADIENLENLGNNLSVDNIQYYMDELITLSLKSISPASNNQKFFKRLYELFKLKNEMIAARKEAEALAAFLAGIIPNFTMPTKKQTAIMIKVQKLLKKIYDLRAKEQQLQEKIKQTVVKKTEEIIEAVSQAKQDLELAKAKLALKKELKKLQKEYEKIINKILSEARFLLIKTDAPPELRQTIKATKDFKPKTHAEVMLQVQAAIYAKNLANTVKMQSLYRQKLIEEHNNPLLKLSQFILYHHLRYTIENPNSPSYIKFDPNKPIFTAEQLKIIFSDILKRKMYNYSDIEKIDFLYNKFVFFDNKAKSYANFFLGNWAKGLSKADIDFLNTVLKYDEDFNHDLYNYVFNQGLFSQYKSDTQVVRIVKILGQNYLEMDDLFMRELLQMGVPISKLKNGYITQQTNKFLLRRAGSEDWQAVIDDMTNFFDWQAMGVAEEDITSVASVIYKNLSGLNNLNVKSGLQNPLEELNQQRKIIFKSYEAWKQWMQKYGNGSNLISNLGDSMKNMGHTLTLLDEFGLDFNLINNEIRDIITLINPKNLTISYKYKRSTIIEGFNQLFNLDSSLPTFTRTQRVLNSLNSVTKTIALKNIFRYALAPDPSGVIAQLSELGLIKDSLGTKVWESLKLITNTLIEILKTNDPKSPLLETFINMGLIMDYQTLIDIRGDPNEARDVYPFVNRFEKFGSKWFGTDRVYAASQKQATILVQRTFYKYISYSYENLPIELKNMMRHFDFYEEDWNNIQQFFNDGTQSGYLMPSKFSDKLGYKTLSPKMIYSKALESGNKACILSARKFYQIFDSIVMDGALQTNPLLAKALRPLKIQKPDELSTAIQSISYMMTEGINNFMGWSSTWVGKEILPENKSWTSFMKKKLPVILISTIILNYGVSALTGKIPDSPKGVADLVVKSAMDTVGLNSLGQLMIDCAEYGLSDTQLASSQWLQMWAGRKTLGIGSAYPLQQSYFTYKMMEKYLKGDNVRAMRYARAAVPLNNWIPVDFLINNVMMQSIFDSINYDAAVLAEMDYIKELYRRGQKPLTIWHKKEITKEWLRKARKDVKNEK